MLEKLLLAIMITFSLNMFLGVRLDTKTESPPKVYLVEMPHLVKQLLQEQALPQLKNVKAADCISDFEELAPE